MPRPYLVGWYYALKDLCKSKYKTKLQRKFWHKQLKRKYYWLTTEERIEQNKKCFDELRKITISDDVRKYIFDYSDDY